MEEGSSIYEGGAGGGGGRGVEGGGGIHNLLLVHALLYTSPGCAPKNHK